MFWAALISLLLALRTEAYWRSARSLRTNVRSSSAALWMTGDSSAGALGKGFGRSIPKPKVITPSQGKVNPELEKFLMMYTCEKDRLFLYKFASS